MQILRRGILAVLTVAFVLSAGGCYQRVVAGDAITFHFAQWIGLLILTIGAAGIAVFVALRAFLKRRNLQNDMVMVTMWGGLAFCLLMLVFITPTMFLDYVVVTPDRFEARYGFWWSPSVKIVRFSDLAELRYVHYSDDRNYAKYRFDCVKTRGTVETVYVGDLVVHAVPDVIAAAEASHVRVTQIDE